MINELRWLSIEPNTILVTIDVMSLYTCIPHPERIQACTEALHKAKESNPSQPDTAVLGCLLEIVLRVMFLSLMTHITNNYMGLLWARSKLVLPPTYLWSNFLTDKFLDRSIELKPKIK